MNGLGSGSDGRWTFLDVVSLISFCIGLENLEMNITQDDMQKSTERLDSSLRKNVDEIHRHLEEQDRKIDTIITLLGGVKK